MGSPRRQLQSINSPQRRLHSPLPVPAKFDQVTHHNKLLCKSPQEPLPVGGIASAVEQKCSRVGQKSRISGLLQPTILGTETQQPVETYLGPKYPEQILKSESFKMETSETIRTSLQAGEWVNSIDFKDAYFHIPIHSHYR